jgi:hypothetical protein
MWTGLRFEVASQVKQAALVTHWPPRSPDLSTCDNSLWGFKKEIVAQQHYQTTDDLKQAVRLAFNRVTPQMLRKMSHRTWRRIILCHEQTDPLDN